MFKWPSYFHCILVMLRVGTSRSESFSFIILSGFSYLFLFSCGAYFSSNILVSHILTLFFLFQFSLSPLQFLMAIRPILEFRLLSSSSDYFLPQNLFDIFLLFLAHNHNLFCFSLPYFCSDCAVFLDI